jgi:hypothetical protein
VTMKNSVFWDMGPCGCYENRRFGGMYRLHLQGRKIRGREKCWTYVSRRLTLFSLAYFFYSEDGDDTFHRNVGSFKINTTPHPRRWQSSGFNVDHTASLQDCTEHGYRQHMVTDIHASSRIRTHYPMTRGHSYVKTRGHCDQHSN